MDFQLQSAIYKQSDQDNQKRFKDNYDPSKKYPHLRGQIAIRVDELQALAKFLKASASLKELETQKFAYYNKATGKTELEDHLAVLLDVTGYQNKTKNQHYSEHLNFRLFHHFLQNQTLQSFRMHRNFLLLHIL